MQVPTESKFCVVLVKPNTELHNKIWNFKGRGNTAPTYCMYEYDRCFVGYEIRFGDGSGMDIDVAEHADLIEVQGIKPEDIWD